MYSQSYFSADRDITPPENYDGTAFADAIMQLDAKPPKIESVKNEMKFSPKNDDYCFEASTAATEKHEPVTNEKQERRGFWGLDLKGFFGSLFSDKSTESFLPKNFGAEEILIIGIALFLLFSPERDIECALLILALIFIR